jgi:hypothetical protein
MIKKSTFFLFLFFSCVSAAENRVQSLTVKKADAFSINVSPNLLFKTSAQIKEAIDNGIRIPIIATAQLYEPKTWWFDQTLINKRLTFDVYYSNLVKLYIIKNKASEETKGFNDYDQLWKGLGNIINFNLQINDNSNLWIKVRVVLDKGGLPTAMQLPVMFDDNWDIDTAWYQQKVKKDG